MHSCKNECDSKQVVSSYVRAHVKFRWVLVNGVRLRGACAARPRACKSPLTAPGQITRAYVIVFNLYLTAVLFIIKITTAKVTYLWALCNNVVDQIFLCNFTMLPFSDI